MSLGVFALSILAIGAVVGTLGRLVIVQREQGRAVTILQQANFDVLPLAEVAITGPYIDVDHTHTYARTNIMPSLYRTDSGVGAAIFRAPAQQSAQVSGLALDAISQCKQLRYLGLPGVQIDVVSLRKVIMNCSQLERCDLPFSSIHDKHMRELATLPCLRNVDVRGCNVSDEGIRHVCECRGITAIYLGGTNVSDDIVDNLGKLDRLEVLDVSNTRVTNKGIMGLTRLRSLREVCCNGCDVGDDAVCVLADKSPSVEWISAVGTRVSADASRRLAESESAVELKWK
jgi:hypothetical protein